MNNGKRIQAGVWTMVAALTFQVGCSARRVELSGLTRPDRASQMDAFQIFVGRWTWEADVVDGPVVQQHWTGKAEWRWALDQRCLAGDISASSGNVAFESTGIWSWHPRARRYIWTMFNNWGYPQQGSATYDGAERRWRMKYRSVGLDGTTSYGLYVIRVVDSDTLDWHFVEWADPLHLIRKMEMKGTYRRVR